MERNCSYILITKKDIHSRIFLVTECGYTTHIPTTTESCKEGKKERYIIKKRKRW